MGMCEENVVVAVCYQQELLRHACGRAGGLMLIIQAIPIQALKAFYCGKTESLRKCLHELSKKGSYHQFQPCITHVLKMSNAWRYMGL